jgi:hypothetical protein
LLGGCSTETFANAVEAAAGFFCGAALLFAFVASAFEGATVVCDPPCELFAISHGAGFGGSYRSSSHLVGQTTRGCSKYAVEGVACVSIGLVDGRNKPRRMVSTHPNG